MKSKELKLKWDVIENLPRLGDYDIIRITAKCHADISLGISPEGYRCLILMLPVDFDFDFNYVEGEKLSLTRVTPNNYVVLSLLDADFRDIFDDLIVSMYNSIRGIECVDTYSKAFIGAFHKWSQFFDRDNGDRLKSSVIQGMFGEIVYLKRLLKECPASKINHVLESWRGPYDQGNDFIFEDRNVEVKTQLLFNSTVRITSEGQLDQLEGKGLELAIVTVDPDSSQAITLFQAVREIVDIVEESLGDVAIFYSALKQKGLGPSNLADYDDISFKACAISLYNCLASDFPKIVRSALSDQLFRVRYSLNTSKLEDYLITREEDL